MNWKQMQTIGIILLANLVLIMSSPGISWGATSGTIDVKVSDLFDDAEEVGGPVYPDIYDLELGDKLCGMRFQNINIPKGSLITNAYIQFTVDEVRNGLTDLTIYAEKHSDPIAFSTSTNDISSRPKTTATVPWPNVPIWGIVGETGVAQQTPDISSVVQEVIDMINWSAGHSIVFIFEGSGERVAKAYKSGYDVAPILHIEYVSNVVEVQVSESSDDAEENSDGTMDYYSPDLDLVSSQLVGVRFQNVAVPQGALITNAYLEFTSDETHIDKSGLTIEIEDQDNPPTFSDFNKISNRTKTGQSVQWNPIAEWDTIYNKYRSPDIRHKLQKIVGRPGWTEGNAMVFILESNQGTRVAVSYDGVSEMAPLLHIEYALDNLPYITVDRTSIGASCYEGNSPIASKFTLTNTGVNDLNYTLSDDASWLSLSSTSGQLNPWAFEYITVTYDTSALAPGTYEASITIEDPVAYNNPVEIQVSVTVFPIPETSSCGHVPVYAENLVSPAILVLLDISGSMNDLMDVTTSQNNPKTPDLSQVVQEIVDRPAWQSGNPMAFIISGSGRRTAKSYDGQSGSAPLLHVEYNDGTDHVLNIRVSQSADDAEERIGENWVHVTSADLEMVDDNGNGDQFIGVRFQNLTIPPGATITKAYIEFVVDETDSVGTSLTIWGEDLDNPPPYANVDDNISSRPKTMASVAWNNIEDWSAVTQERRIDIGKAVISDLVKDRSISWGFGTWTYKEDAGYVEAIDYTKIHEGCKLHDNDHQLALQAAISNPEPLSMTPLAPSIEAANKYFAGQKKDKEGTGDFFVESDCQPKFMITVTDGRGNTGSSVSLVGAATAALADSRVTPIGVGFGLDYSEAEQLYELAKVANEKGKASDTDDIYALHPEDGSGVGEPYFAFNKEELITALSAITENIKGAIFHGSAPAPTTSTDLGDMVIVAKFDASRWSGDVEAVTKDTNGLWVNTIWAASEELPAARKIYTIDPATDDTVIEYTDAVLATDNFSCFDPTNKPIGDIINSTPVVVGYPAFFYPFNNYTDFKFNTIRDTMVYIGANDGSLHAIDLVSGVEQWAFIPKSMHAKLNKAQTDPLYDRCDPEFCHQYYVDGSPIVGDVYAKFDGFSDEWRTMLVIGEREGGEAYFALDVTSGRNFSDLDPTKFLWEFTDDQLGQTWADPSIDRVAVDGSATDTAWGVFFGSGYSSTDQSSKTAYLYGILAHDASMLWKDQNDMPTNRVKISRTFLNYEHEHNGGFVVGMEITGEKSLDTATIVSVDLGAKILELDYATGVFQKDEKLFVAGIHVGCITEIASEMSLVNDALASPLLVDLEADYVVDRIYVGNLYGNMYRVTNIGKHMTPQVTTLFTYGNTSADINPIRAKADYAFTDIDGEIWLYFGSGRYENQVDKQDNNQQYFFGLKDGQSPAVTYEPADLVTLQAKFKTVQIDGKDVTVRYIEGTNDYAVPWKMQLYEGTFIDGPVSSGTERVITQPLVVAGVVFFTTFIPDESVCAGNGETWVLAVDYQSGLAPTEPIFDLNGDGKFDDEDKIDIDGDGIKDTIPVGIKVGRGKGSRPVLHKDTLFITTTGDGDDGGGSGNDAEDFFAKKINLKQKKVTLEAWRYR